MTEPRPDDPCPCGSGRTHRQCCLDGDEARAAVAALARLRESTIAKLLTFAFQPAFDSDHAVAEIMFWGELVRDGAADELQALLNTEDANVKYNSWFLFDWDVEGQGTVADLFLEEETARVSPAERQFLDRMAHAHLRLYEVAFVHRGRGLRLVDLWSGAALFVVERSATTQIVTWDLLGARVAPDGMGGNVFEGGVYLYPAEARERIVTHFRKLHRRYQRKFPGHDSAAFFRAHAVVFNQLWLDLVAFPDVPDVTTAEGDPLMFSRAMFDTPDPDRVRAAMASAPGVRALADGRFAWRDAADGDQGDLGTWGFEGPRIVFETTSPQRAARGRAWLEALAGDLVRFRAVALETLEQAMDEIRRQPAEQDVPPGRTDVVRELYDRHYATWVDRPVPFLGNRTPRAAARTKLWRARVVELLKQMENASERATLSGRPAYDFRWLWNELGLERPGR